MPFGRPYPLAHRISLSHHMAQKHKAMNTFITFFDGSSNDKGKGGLFAGVFHEEWVQQHNLFERICAPFVLSMEETCDYARLTLKTVALVFYDDPILLGAGPLIWLKTLLAYSQGR